MENKTAQTETALPARKTLAELNAPTPSMVYEWSGYTLHRLYAVGTSGRRGSGSHYHLLRTDVVAAVPADYKPGSHGVGDFHSVAAPCNTNGQHNGRVAYGVDTDKITCSKCLKFMGVAK